MNRVHVFLRFEPRNHVFPLQIGPRLAGNEQSVVRRCCSGEVRPRRRGLGGGKERGAHALPLGARNQVGVVEVGWSVVRNGGSGMVVDGEVVAGVLGFDAGVPEHHGDERKVIVRIN